MIIDWIKSLFHKKPDEIIKLKEVIDRVNSEKEILLTGFCSCLTSFSGVINFLYEVFLKKNFFELFFYINLIVIFNLIVMYFGCLISRTLA